MLFLLALTSRFHSISLKKASLSYSTFPKAIRLQIALLSFSFNTPLFFSHPQPRDSSTARKKIYPLSFCIKDALFLVLSNKLLQNALDHATVQM